MAKVYIKMPDEFLEKISRLGSEFDSVAKDVLKAGGEIVFAKVKSNLSAVVGKGTKFPARATGELASALGLSPVMTGKNGDNHNVKIGFAEPRRNNYAAKGKRSYKEITNAMIANVIEYGKHGQPAKPFLKPAKTASKAECISVMEQKLEEAIKNR